MADLTGVDVEAMGRALGLGIAADDLVE